MRFRQDHDLDAERVRVELAYLSIVTMHFCVGVALADRAQQTRVLAAFYRGLWSGSAWLASEPGLNERVPQYETALNNPHPDLGRGYGMGRVFARLCGASHDVPVIEVGARGLRGAVAPDSLAAAGRYGSLRPSASRSPTASVVRAIIGSANAPGRRQQQPRAVLGHDAALDERRQHAQRIHRDETHVIRRPPQGDGVVEQPLVDLAAQDQQARGPRPGRSRRAGQPRVPRPACVPNLANGRGCIEHPHEHVRPAG